MKYALVNIGIKFVIFIKKTKAIIIIYTFAELTYGRGSAFVIAYVLVIRRNSLQRLKNIPRFFIISSVEIYKGISVQYCKSALLGLNICSSKKFPYYVCRHQKPDPRDSSPGFRIGDTKL